LKRAYLRKVKPVSNKLCSASDLVGQPEQELKGVRRKARTSAAMVGLALSMGATGFLLPRQNDGASAAEPKGAEAAVSSASEATILPTSVGEASIATVSPEKAQLLEYTVRHGDTLQHIAEKYQVALAEITKANNLTATSILRVGQLIKVPKNDFSVSLAENNATAKAERDQSLDQLRLQREKLRDRLVGLRSEQTTAQAQSQNQPSAPNIITELPPEASQSVAQKQDSVVLPLRSSDANDTSSVQVPGVQSSASQLVATNSLPEPDWIRANQSLLNQPPAPSPVASPSTDTLALRSTSLPVTQPTPLAEPARVDQNLINAAANSSEFVAYRINLGDTIADIARAHNVSPSVLVSANHLSDPNIIFVGQVLQVPASQAETVAPAPKVASISTISTSSVAEPSIASVPVTIPMQSSEVVTVPTVPTASAQPVSTVLPQQVAVAPSIAVPTVPEVVPVIQPGLQAAPSVPAVGGTNPYVQSLLSEVRTLRQQYSQNGQRTANAQPTAVSVSAVAPITPAANPAPTVAASSAASRAVVMNPQFQQRNENAAQVSSSAANSEAQSNLVAVAPIGSENYEPLLQPIAGRMVSPDLPPLPGADNFLPSSRGVFNGYIWPAKGQLSSGYGWRWGRMHRGIDIAADVGTPIYAAADGVVESAGWNSGGYGNMIDIRHADGSVTRYAHLNRILIQDGQHLKQGQQIAEMGSTGYSTGPHLHFEVHSAQGTVNPISYLPGR
jgi:murein DD-endopeptidase MepM/ murein hydrolase activator NlpD